MFNTIHENSASAQRKAKFSLPVSLYTAIFSVLALVVFLLGVFTLGSFNHTGKNVVIPRASKTFSLAYRLDYEEGQTLDSIYVNVGAVYAEPGTPDNVDTMQLRAYYYNGNNWTSTIGSFINVGSIYSTNDAQTYISNANYNWVPLVTDRTLSQELIRISFTAGRANGRLNEVAFVDQDGGLIQASPAAEHTEGFFTKEQIACTLDAQSSFKVSNSYFNNFTYEEQYILASIDGIETDMALKNEDGKVGMTAGAIYPMSTDYNSFGILVYALFTFIFGKSTFALRLPSFLASFGTFVLLFLLARKLFKSDKWGLVLAALFPVSGLFFTVGRMGTPLALALFFVVASIYCMYLFYSKGISDKIPALSALPVLLSGVFAMLAFCVQTLAILPCILSLVLFVLGVARLYQHKLYRISKAQQATVEDLSQEQAEQAFAQADQEVRKIKADFRYKLRLSVAFLVASLFIGVLVLVLSALPTFGSYMRYYVQEEFFTALWKGISQCTTIDDLTPYTAGNAFTSFAWVIGLKGATIFNKTVEGGALLQMNVQVNPMVAYAAALSFLFSTVYVVVKLITMKEDDKKFNTAFKAYIALFIGMMTSFLPYLFMENVSTLQSYPFYLFYASFIALAFFILDGMKPQNEGRQRMVSIAVNASLLALIGGCVLVFALSSPMLFGWQVSAELANALFGWTSILSNGQYGVIALA